jgi:hypothetical protein
MRVLFRGNAHGAIVEKVVTPSEAITLQRYKSQPTNLDRHTPHARRFEQQEEK